MSESILSKPHFHNEEAAYAFVEAHIWPNGPVCPHCGGVERISRMGGKSTRVGAYKCYNCRKPFTVKIGTIFESSHIPMRLWLQAIFLISSSKKGISSNQLHRTLGITLKSAWFMSHRIREAMKDDGGLLGSGGGIVEVDETYIGQNKQVEQRRGYAHKNTVVSLVERGGDVRSFHVDEATTSSIRALLTRNMSRDGQLMTDQSSLYKKAGQAFASHESVNHAQKEYVRGDAHTNTIEGFFSIFKRGMKGVYQHCGNNHLHRYLTEFDFRYNNRKVLGVEDQERAANLLRGVVGKRLTYETTTQ